MALHASKIESHSREPSKMTNENKKSSPKGSGERSKKKHTLKVQRSGELVT